MNIRLQAFTVNEVKRFSLSGIFLFYQTRQLFLHVTWFYVPGIISLLNIVASHSCTAVHCATAPGETRYDNKTVFITFVGKALITTL